MSSRMIILEATRQKNSPDHISQFIIFNLYFMKADDSEEEDED